MNLGITAQKLLRWYKTWLARPDVDEMRRTRNVQGLIRALNSSADGYTREMAAKHLGYLKDEKAVVQLCRTLRNRYVEDLVRGAAATALGEIGGEAAVDALLAVLEAGDKGSPPGGGYLLGRVAEALIETDNPRAIERVLEALRDGSIGVIYHWAIKLLMAGDERAILPLCRSVDFPSLIVSPYDSLARDIANRLRQLGAPAEEELCRMLADERSSLARRNAARWLGSTVGGMSAVGPLSKALSDQDREVRINAATSLSNFGEPAVEPLCDALRNGDRPLRYRAAESLGWIGSERASDALCKLLADKQEDVPLRETAASALGEIGGAQAMEALSSFIQSEYGGNADCDKELFYLVKRVEKAISALSKIGDGTTITLFCGLVAEIQNQESVPYATIEEYRSNYDRWGDAREKAFRCLKDVLQRNLDNADSAQLRHVLALRDEYNRYGLYPDDYDEPALGRYTLNCAPLKQIARIELARRGIEE